MQVDATVVGMLMVVKIQWVFSDGLVDAPVYAHCLDNVEEAQ